ncbi:hypothetical protein B0H11DRAFT_1913652 [Mycena galericulata]|nr:hypothetical protein B0H11DRAFT_1913652 [Mycena galericulata]
MPAQRSKKSKAKKTVTPPPPPPFRFKGARRAWLDPQVDAFITAMQKGSLDTFFRGVFTLYWQTFPWRLPVDQEPFPGMAFDDPDIELSVRDRIERDYIVTRTNVHEFDVVVVEMRPGGEYFVEGCHGAPLAPRSLPTIHHRGGIGQRRGEAGVDAAHPCTRFRLLESLVFSTIPRLSLSARVCRHSSGDAGERIAEGGRLRGAGVGLGIGAPIEAEVHVPSPSCVDVLIREAATPEFRMPPRQKKPPVLRSRSFWADLQRSRAERKSHSEHRTYDGPIELNDAHPIYTIVPGRSAPIITAPPRAPNPLAGLNLGPKSPHTPMHSIPMSKEAADVARRHPQKSRDADAVLLARLASGHKRVQPEAPADAASERKGCTCPTHRPPRKKKLVATSCVPGRTKKKKSRRGKKRWRRDRPSEHKLQVVVVHVGVMGDPVPRRLFICIVRIDVQHHRAPIQLVQAPFDVLFAGVGPGRVFSCMLENEKGVFAVKWWTTLLFETGHPSAIQTRVLWIRVDDSEMFLNMQSIAREEGTAL